MLFTQVCSQWLACGVSGDVGDLSRVQQLLVNSLSKLRKEGPSEAGLNTGSGQFGETVATLESLAVLRAWAEVCAV